MNDRRAMAVICGFCFAVASLRFEWSWGVAASETFWLRVVSATVPLGILLIAGLAMGAFRYRGDPLRLLFVAAGASLFGAIVLIHTIAPNELAGGVRPDFYVALLQMVVCAAIGYWLARNLRDIRWALSRLAFALTVLAVYAPIVRHTGLAQTIPYLVPSFYMGLLISFAFCWHLCQWLIGEGRRGWSLIGLLACCPELLFSFQKPVVPGVAAASVVVFVYCLPTSRRAFRVLARTLVLCVLCVMMFGAVNVASSNRLATYIETKVRNKFLHLNKASRRQNLYEMAQQAAANRFHLWEKAIDTIQTSPVIGSGFGPLVRSGTKRSGPEEYVHVHNGYLDLLVSAGLLGALPVLVGLIWWFSVVSRPNVLSHVGTLVIPCVGYVASIMTYNFGACSRTFFSVNSFTVFLMAIAVGVADHALAATAVRRQPRASLAYRSSRPRAPVAASP